MSIRRILSAGALFLLADAALAQQAIDVPAITDANRQVYVGAGGQRLQYTELADGYFADSEIGKQYAATAGAFWQGDLFGLRSLYARGQTWFARGKTAYTGFLQNGLGQTTPYDSTTNVETADYLVRIGKGFGDPKDGMILVFADLGAHRWSRDSSVTDPYGYLEVYKHKDASLGAMAQAAFSERLVGAIELSVGSTFGSQISVPSQQASEGLKHERLLGAALSFDYAFLRRLHARVEYRQSSFNYGRSQVFTSSFGPAYEPDSRTYQGVAMFTLGYGL